MKARAILLLYCISAMGYLHRPCKTLGELFGCDCIMKRAQPELQDMSVQLPVFDHTLSPDTDLDGYALQAIRIAADDFLGADPTGLPCAYRQSSHSYKTLRQGDVIFIRIDFKPENCGRTEPSFDGGATYAISVDGRILRRELDGEGFHFPQDSSP